MFRSILLGSVVFGVIGFIGFLIYAHEPAIDPITQDNPQGFDPETVEKGRILAAAGYCSTCHTAEGGAPFAGNLPMATGFGTIYSTNITPDVETGIGAWSQVAFQRAMHEGVDREGQHLFPAFPYNHFTKMTDEDVDAIYAFIMTDVDPVPSVQKENGLPFPLNLRFLQAGWKLLFVDSGVYQADASESDAWNRGAYLVEGVTHCGACHTPRNALGAEREDDRFGGAEVEQWIAPALTAANPSPVPWTAAAFAEFIETGSAQLHGIAAGPMSPVVHAGLRELSEDDLNAIGVYLADQDGAHDSDAEVAEIVNASLAEGQPDKSYRMELGERLYATTCAACHYNVEQIVLGRPDLGINSATRFSEPDNLIHVILNGVTSPEGIPGVVMPSFRTAMSDEEVAAIAAYLRASRTDEAAWPELSQKVSTIRAEATASE
ncbi:mono/diheme cytochrome c family protein [Primorskyibacter sedentarius]|uniref:Mono/diheme cytochrome c family protein n=1 Tax=Primorskyibacter sedentarius TaxID=745311 RepID=A0A4R3ITM5_9RHOB|nr:cytochrome c [Primorskyibacter sedentarius]TCS54471.1 mono/diheme cytochrome c family protein [Primorskyibacter sedentarius]